MVKVVVSNPDEARLDEIELGEFGVGEIDDVVRTFQHYGIWWDAHMKLNDARWIRNDEGEFVFEIVVTRR